MSHDPRPFRAACRCVALALQVFAAIGFAQRTEPTDWFSTALEGTTGRSRDPTPVVCKLPSPLSLTI